MGDVRLVVLHNNVSELETCPFCSAGFRPAIGYIALAMDADRPAIEGQPVCDVCARRQEPALMRMIELLKSYEQFENQMAEMGKKGVLDPAGQQ